MDDKDILQGCFWAQLSNKKQYHNLHKFVSKLYVCMYVYCRPADYVQVCMYVCMYKSLKMVPLKPVRYYFKAYLGGSWERGRQCILGVSLGGLLDISWDGEVRPSP